MVLLGGAFAGVVTGNLVNLGHGLVVRDPRVIVPVVVAVCGFAVGVVVWARVWRGVPDAVAGPLAAELAVLVAALLELQRRAVLALPVVLVAMCLLVIRRPGGPRSTRPA